MSENAMKHTQAEKVLTNPPRDYTNIRELLLEKPPREIRHELPQLIETIADSDDPERLPERYIIGVSFTKNGSCFDYWIDQVFQSEESHQVEEFKEPINPNHHYVSFSYPPDPHFDAATLRGCLLSTVERRYSSQDSETQSDEQYGLIHRLRKAIFSRI